MPPLVFVDMFEVQFDSAAPLRSEYAPTALTNCRLVLNVARLIGWPLGFAVDAQRLGRGPHSGATWINGFRPYRSDMVFETNGESCYSSMEFAEAISSAGNCFLLAGFFNGRACLTTLVEASAHGHHGGLIEDACYFSPLNGLDAPASRQAHIAVASCYATTLTTTELLDIGNVPQSELEFTDDAK